MDRYKQLPLNLATTDDIINELERRARYSKQKYLLVWPREDGEAWDGVFPNRMKLAIEDRASLIALIEHLP